MYWRIGANPMHEALNAASALQNALRMRFPLLSTRLLHRGAGTDKATVMEIYTQAGGVGETLLGAIEVEAAVQLGALRQPPQRHVELFTSVSEPPSR